MIEKGTIALITVCLLLTACSTTKHIPEGDALYTGADVKLNASNVSSRQEKVIKADLEDMTKPEPNARFLGIPFKLLLWNLFYTKKEKGLKAGLQKKLGNPPVLASSLDLEANQKLLQNYLENKGFFSANVLGDSTWNNKKAHATYTANAGPQYKIRSVTFEEDSSSKLTSAIHEVSKNTLLKPGEPYDLDLIKGERERIDAMLKERGFFYFSPEYLLMQVDSTVGTHQVDIRVITKPDMPDVARNVYYIDDVYIYSNYSLNTARRDTNRTEGTFYKGYHVIDPEGKFKPQLFSHVMLFKPGDIYNRTDHNQTLHRLMDLGVFKFVKNRFDPAESSLDTNKLDVFYYLTPQPEKSLRAEVGANTKSNNLNGSELSIGFKHRNTFRGAELMDIRAYVGTEAQFSGSFQGTSTFRIGGEVNFGIPRFVVPFLDVKPKTSYIPRTNIQLGYEALNRKGLYTLNSFRGGLGYIWKESLMQSHELYPISITYVQPLKVTEKFQQDTANNPTLRHIIDQQFILGSTYQYTYNQQAAGLQRLNSFYFNGLAEVSGNLAGLLTSAGSNGKKELFGLPFSQYAKLELDGRYYRRIGLNSSWANRLLIGYGAPYGNSDELPYIKQFFIGGNNSLRAFRSRTVGPGTYDAKPTTLGNYIPDQTGDIKLEMNTEYRPHISGPLYGAVFVDAGNIWLARPNSLKPGAAFSKDFLKELAVGTGVGIRLDIQIFVIRLDVAFPIRKPWLPEGQRWVAQHLSLNEAVYNLAIGYPF